jgi:hypothetical protein
MPGLSLEIVAAKLGRELGLLASDQKWRLSLTAKLSADDRLRFTTGEDIGDVVIYATFKAVDADYRAHYLKAFPTLKGDATGILSYFPARAPDFSEAVPATVFFETYLTEAEHADLIEFARQGRYPTRLTFHIADNLGMKYGLAPDGSEKEWDTKTSQRIPIEGVGFDMTIAESAGEPDHRPPLDTILLPMLRGSFYWQRWTFFLVLAIGVLLLLRH